MSTGDLRTYTNKIYHLIINEIPISYIQGICTHIGPLSKDWDIENIRESLAELEESEHVDIEFEDLAEMDLDELGDIAKVEEGEDFMDLAGSLSEEVRKIYLCAPMTLDFERFACRQLGDEARK